MLNGQIICANEGLIYLTRNGNIQSIKPKLLNKMSKRKQPQTSIDAHNSVKPDKEALHAQIIVGMKALRVGGTFEEIASASNLQPAQVWKRLSEMIEAGTVFNTGITHPTSSGRQAMVRQLTELKQKPCAYVQEKLF